MKTNQIHTYLKILCLVLLSSLWLAAASLAQQVEGIVTDQTTGERLVGVNVVVQNTTIGTATNRDGEFQLQVPSLQETLVISYIGYVTQEVEIDGRSEIDISLEQQPFYGDDIVVVGYGEIRRSDLTGSVSSVSAARLAETPTSNAIEAIQGKVPGMDITRSSGQPGSGLNIRIRGNRSLTASNSPLFIVDGIQYSNIDDLNPADIESIEVLRDASSTAIYGSRGANGVVLISTKQAARNVTEVTINSSVGVHNVYAYPDIMTGPQFVERARQAGRSQGLWDGPVDRIHEFTVLQDDENVLSPQDRQAIENGTWTDYRDLLLDPGIQQDYRIGIATGTENTRVYLSMNFYDEAGILEKDNMRRYSGRLNVDQRLSDVVTIGLNTQVSISDHDRRREPFNMANKINPLHEAYMEDGSINIQPTDRDISPLADLVPNSYENNERTMRFFPTLYAQITPFENLSIRSNLSGTFTNNRHGIYRGSATIDRAFAPPQAIYETGNSRSLTFENIATYGTSINDHSLSFTAIQSYLYNKNEFSLSQGENQLLNTQLYYGLVNAPSNNAINSGYEESSLSSFAGRINYGWDHKYLLTVTGRYDGSSRLAEGNKWAFFPSVAAAWRIIEEGFMQNSALFSDLKLRVSYGISGNEAISPYSTQSSLTRVPMAFNNSSLAGYRFSNLLGNRNLEWELSETTNLGLDIGLLSNRLYASIDLYNTETSNLLLERSLPPTSGVTSVTQNVGETRNRGIEIALNSKNINSQRFSWETDLTFFANKEEIVSLVTDDDNIGNGWFIGHPANVFYDYEKIGIWQENEADEAASYGQEPGHIRVRDQNQSGEITAADDRIILGSPRPDWSGGLDNRFRFRNFDANISLFARVGQMMNFSLYNSFKDGPEENGVLVDYWTPENPDGSFPRPGAGTSYRSTINYVDASFLKLRNATIGYTLPSDIAQQFSLRSLRVYATGRNLHVWTKLDNYDPERGGAPSYPMTRLFVLGVDLQF